MIEIFITLAAWYLALTNLPLRACSVPLHSLARDNATRGVLITTTPL